MSTSLTRRSFLTALGGTLGAWAAGCKRGDDYWRAAEADLSGDTTIVRAAIHPAIGVARVGNSDREFLVAPEVDDPAPRASGASHDSTGALKREAARFRVYGFNAAGQIVKELTAADASIQWRVHVANRKAAWYRFEVALDLPEAREKRSKRRNPTMTGDARRKLVIDPGPHQIAGPNQVDRLDGGAFMNTPVSLGELRTDEAGRLLVLGGLGRSASPTNQPLHGPSEGDLFNNGDGWFDDTSDGPVTATVTIDARPIPVDSAWVVVAPPSYAPDVVGWRTLYDLLVETFVDAGMLEMPSRTSFARDIAPALRRLSTLSWVNAGFLERWGTGAQWNFEDPAFMAKLADPAAGADLRAAILAKFRGDGGPKDRWPPLYGDAAFTYDQAPSARFSPSRLFMTHLERWARGDFEPGQAGTPPRRIEDVPLGEQPAMLDRAALTFCLADAFHPGCEVTWTMRHASLFDGPFRIRLRSGDARDFGDELSAAAATGADGCLEAQGPGDLTKWMGLPWQGDTAACGSGYDPAFDPFLPTFWPARVPNHVLTAEDYAIAVDASRPRNERVAAFKRRQPWARHLAGTGAAKAQNLVRDFAKMGVLERRPGVENDAELPAQMFVESLAASASCTSGDGLYCGDNGVPGDPNTLYRCNHGQSSVERECPSGCEKRPPGQNDRCHL